MAATCCGGQVAVRQMIASAGAEENSRGLGSVDHHQDDHVRLGASLAHRRGGGAAGGFEVGERGGAEVVAADVEAGADQVAGHRATHGPKTDEGDTLHAFLPRERGRTPPDRRPRSRRDGS